MSTPKGPEGIGQLAAEVGRRFGLYHEQVDGLQTERTQENERLRADLGRLEAEIARVNQAMTDCEARRVAGRLSPDGRCDRTTTAIARLGARWVGTDRARRKRPA